VRTARSRAALAILCLGLASVAQAETVQNGKLRVSVEAKVSPRRLPRVGAAPVSLFLAGKITTTDDSTPPQLRTIMMAINRNGRLDSHGLPSCRYRQIQPTSTEEAREACPGSLVGSGAFEANVALPEQFPFPSNGRILAFNGKLHGKPVIFAHIFGTEPLPRSFTLPIEVRHRASGRYGTVLVARLPRVAAQFGFVTGISLKLGRTYRSRGKAHGYIESGCPAPKGFPGASFALAKASFSFADGRTLTSILNRSCHAKG
jgi:hypothetical protein